MANPIQAAGGTIEPSEYAPLGMDRYITGLCTQRSPLRDAALPYSVVKAYGGRTDSLIDGLNTEISAELTLIRRCGLSVYNRQSFPAIDRFYPFRLVVDGKSQVRVIADTAAAIYDATGPNTKTLLYTKGAGDGKTCFQSVGNTLYMSTGGRQLKWMQASTGWAAGKTFTAGQWIVDPNNNIQLLQTQRTADVIAVTISGNVLSIDFDGPNPFTAGQPVNLTGLTQAAFLNGATVTVLGGTYVNGIRAALVHPDRAKASETGSATYGVASGATGAAQPGWQSTRGAYTSDGTLQWLCWGSAIQNWGIVAPTLAPTVTQASLPSNYPGWTANTTYATVLALIDTNSNVQVLSTSGTLGSAQPSWSSSPGAITQDGTAQWQCAGNGAWQPYRAYALGAYVVAKYSYYVQVYHPTGGDNSDTPSYGSNQYQQQRSSGSGGYYTSQPVQVTELFSCSQAGSSAGTAPDWSSATGVGSVVADGSVQWTNLGTQVTWASFGAGAKLSANQTIVDSNGFLQQISTSGKSGASAPVWSQTLSAVTADNTVNWTNLGSYSAANTGAWQWVFAYKSSIDGSVSSASGKSIAVMQAQGNMSVLQGRTSTDPQVDTIVLFRTNQAGSILLYEDEFPQPAGTLWTYFDTSPDDVLNALLTAPLNGVNDPPPTGINALAFHVNRLWAAVQNLVYFCTGPDTSIGNGFTSWSVSNQFGYPDAVARLVPVTLSNGALLCFTASAVQSVFGLGTSSSPFYPTTYVAGVGLLGHDALDIVGSTIHLFTTAAKLVSLDPSAGYTETGYPIGDQFRAVTTGGINPTAHYNAANTYVSWHESGSGDTGLFVSDGSVGWFRYSPVSSPESGFIWSPRAAIEGGTSAVQSVDTYPGVRTLLVGPLSQGPILMRDYTVNADDGVPYADTYAVAGSIQMAQSGQLAEIAHVTLDSRRVGTAPTVGLLLGEIFETAEVGFDMLEKTDNDPPNLPESETLYSERFSCLQNETAPLCRHMQLLIQWASEDAASELFQHTIYGAVHSERRQQ